jgi:hypothetical protein
MTGSTSSMEHDWFANLGRIGVPACTLQSKAMDGGSLAAIAQAWTPMRPGLPTEKRRAPSALLHPGSFV